MLNSRRQLGTCTYLTSDGSQADFVLVTISEPD